MFVQTVSAGLCLPGWQIDKRYSWGTHLPCVGLQYPFQGILPLKLLVTYRIETMDLVLHVQDWHLFPKEIKMAIQN